MKARTREELHTAIPVIFNGEFSKIWNQGYDFVTNIPQYVGMKASLCRQRRRVLGTTQNPDTSDDIHFNHELLKLSDGTSFLKSDFYIEEKRILILGSTIGLELLKSQWTFFAEVTFKSCPKQYQQVYTIHADIGSDKEETSVFLLFIYSCTIN